MSQLIPFRRLLESPGTCPKIANSRGMGKIIPFPSKPATTRPDAASNLDDKCATCQYSASSECVPQLCQS